MANEKTNEDLFEQFIQSQQEQRLSRGGYQVQFEQIKYLDLSNQPAIFRLVGKPLVDGSAYHRDPTDSKEVYVARVKDDFEKSMYLILPVYGETLTDNHIIHKIVQDVKKKEYIQRKPVFVNEFKYPEIFKLVTKSGFTETDPNYNFATDWSGRRMFLINAIDRKDDWCRENKHTKILSKKIGYSVNSNGETTEWPEKGVSSSGFLNSLSQIITDDGNWENYDICIRKSDVQFMPYTAWNASKCCSPEGIKLKLNRSMKLSDDLIQRISFQPLTDEELNYERYNIDQCFHYTSYAAILKRLGKSIKRIDAALNRHYYDELTALAEKERNEFEEKRKQEEEKRRLDEGKITAMASVALDSQEYFEDDVSEENDFSSKERYFIEESETIDPNKEENNSVSDSETQEKSSLPTRRQLMAQLPNGLTPEKVGVLGGWSALTSAEKNRILDIELNSDGSLKDIVYDPSESLLDDEINDGGCGFKSPSDFTHCPVCGRSFI